jgi:hypothetical protein
MRVRGTWLFSLVVALAVLAVMIPRINGSNAQAQPAPDGEDQRGGPPVVQPVEPVPVDPVPVPALPLVLQCFRLVEGDDPNAVVRLTTDNFGNDLVEVQTANQYCESATKLRPATNETYGNNVQHGFQCFKVEHGNVIGDPYLLNTANFGPDRVVAGQLVMMCESAIKVRLSPTGVEAAPFGSITPAHVLACYSTRFGADPNAAVVLRTPNFGPDRVAVRQANLLCEEASKYHPQPTGPALVIGRPTGLVYQCFATEGGQNLEARAILGTRNFGRDGVLIGTGTMMCEQARKTPLFHLPPDTVDAVPAPAPVPATVR